MCFYVTDISKVAVQFQDTRNVSIGGLSSSRAPNEEWSEQTAAHYIDEHFGAHVSSAVRGLFSVILANATDNAMNAALNSKLGMMHGCRSTLP